MLAVVEDDEEPLRTEVVEHHFIDRPHRVGLRTEARGQGVPNHVRIGDRSEFAQPRALWEFSRHLGRDFERKTRLPHTTDGSK